MDRDVYEEEWNDNKMNGYGVYTWSNGFKCKGEYKDDIKHSCILVRKPILNFIFKLFNIWFNFFKKQVDIEEIAFAQGGQCGKIILRKL